jgi:hypothetical protein
MKAVRDIAGHVHCTPEYRQVGDLKTVKCSFESAAMLVTLGIELVDSTLPAAGASHNQQDTGFQCTQRLGVSHIVPRYNFDCLSKEWLTNQSNIRKTGKVKAFPYPDWFLLFYLSFSCSGYDGYLSKWSSSRSVSHYTRHSSLDTIDTLRRAC